MIEQSKSYINEGLKIWYLPSKGKDHFHRLDGPAVEYKNGTKYWFVEGNRHRLDGPAAVLANGRTKWWYVDGRRHRIDGPAIEYKDGTKQWWVNDTRLSTEEVETWLKENDVDLTTEAGQMAFKLRWA